MRILSQDGKYDFPYERVCLDVSDSGKIFAQWDIWGAEDNYIEAAKYESESKARKAMEMLRHWKELRAIRNIPLSEDVATNSEFSKFIKKNFDVSVFYDECAKMDIEKTCEYFQFPKNNEIEV